MIAVVRLNPCGNLNKLLWSLIAILSIPFPSQFFSSVYAHYGMPEHLWNDCTMSEYVGNGKGPSHCLYGCYQQLICFLSSILRLAIDKCMILLQPDDKHVSRVPGSYRTVRHHPRLLRGIYHGLQRLSFLRLEADQKESVV